MTDDPPTCPRCGSASVPIVYGLPGAAVFDAYDRGEIAFGGCVIVDDDPGWACTGLDCGIRFGESVWSPRGLSAP